MTKVTHPFASCIASFSKELDRVAAQQLPLAGYPAAYLQLLLTHRIYYLHIYAQVLQQVVQHSAKPKEALILLDYGAGNGLLGMFARHCGFGQVYSIDVNEQFVQAARLLNNRLQHPVEVLLTGDWNAVERYCCEHPVPDAVVGTDVIEHIYNVGVFLQQLKKMNPAMVAVFTTASVTANPFKTRALRRLQRQDEYLWTDPEHTAAGNPYAGMPFLEVRKRMIAAYTALPEQHVAALAGATRGMREADILKAADLFIKTGTMPAPPTHPTNTCDPVTGSWTEQLITTKKYKQMFASAGFCLRVQNGFYNQWQGGIKGKLLQLLNVYTRWSGRMGRWLSAYIVLIGK